MDFVALRAFGLERLGEPGQALGHLSLQTRNGRLGPLPAEQCVPFGAVEIIQGPRQCGARLLDRTQVGPGPKEHGDQGVDHDSHHRFDLAKHGGLEHVVRVVQVGKEDDQADVAGHRPHVGVLLPTHHHVDGEEHPAAGEQDEGPAILRRQGLDDQGGQTSRNRSHHAKGALPDRFSRRGQRDHGHGPTGPGRVHPADPHGDGKNQDEGQGRLDRFLQLGGVAHQRGLGELLFPGLGPLAHLVLGRLGKQGVRGLISPHLPTAAQGLVDLDQVGRDGSLGRGEQVLLPLQ